MGVAGFVVQHPFTETLKDTYKHNIKQYQVESLFRIFCKGFHTVSSQYNAVSGFLYKIMQ